MIVKFDGLEPWRCGDIKGIVTPRDGSEMFRSFWETSLSRRHSLLSLDTSHDATVSYILYPESSLEYLFINLHTGNMDHIRTCEGTGNR